MSSRTYQSTDQRKALELSTKLQSAREVNQDSETLDIDSWAAAMGSRLKLYWVLPGAPHIDPTPVLGGVYKSANETVGQAVRRAYEESGKTAKDYFSLYQGDKASGATSGFSFRNGIADTNTRQAGPRTEAWSYRTKQLKELLDNPGKSQSEWIGKLGIYTEPRTLYTHTEQLGTKRSHMA